jgi:hypothetical protein
LQKAGYLAVWSCYLLVGRVKKKKEKKKIRRKKTPKTIKRVRNKKDWEEKKSGGFLEQREGRKDWLSKDLEDACLEAWSSFVCVLGSVDPGNPSIPTP